MRITKVVRYRVSQFLRALTAPHAISERRIDRASEILSPQAQALFMEQAFQDQRHALDVYDALLEEGHTNEDLLTAALLHDVGKAGVHASPWQRGVFVLAKRFAPWALGALLPKGAGAQESPFATYANHAEIGARRAERAGCSALTVDLIRHHERGPMGCHSERDRLLTALRAADSAH